MHSLDLLYRLSGVFSLYRHLSFDPVCIPIRFNIGKPSFISYSPSVQWIDSLLIGRLIRLFIYLSVYLATHSLIDVFMHLYVNSSIAYSFTDSWIHSFFD